MQCSQLIMVIQIERVRIEDFTNDDGCNNENNSEDRVKQNGGEGGSCRQ